MNFYEIHFTVDNADKDLFINTCKNNNIKTTEIAFSSELLKVNHCMTSVKYTGDYVGLLLKLKELENIFSNVSIIRKKVEVNNSESFTYIETHLELPNHNFDLFLDLNKTDWVISFNVKKRETFSITKRIFNIKEIENIHNEYLDFSYLLLDNSKLELEYCILDSNVFLDSGWI